MQAIYAIVNRVSGRRYIGSSTDVARRWREHERELRKGTHANPVLLAAWRKYGEGAFDLEIVEEVFDRADLLAREQAHIDGTPNRYNLSTVAGRPTGWKGKRHSAEALAKMRAAALNRPPQSRESIERAAAKKRGKKLSDEHRQRLSAIRKGRPGKPLTEQAKEKIRLANLGKTASAATRAKMGASQRKRTQPSEVREKIRASLMGHGLTEETRLKMRKSALQRWQRTLVTDEYRQLMKQAANKRWNNERAEAGAIH